MSLLTFCLYVPFQPESMCPSIQRILLSLKKTVFAFDFYSF